MKAVVVEQVGSFVITDRPVPEPGPGEVLLRVTVTGLCRTDLKLIRAGHRDLILPRIPGEEVVGTICETGEGVRGLQTGQRVYVYPGISCGACRPCRAGAGNLCEGMRIMGFHRDGGFAEYVCTPAQSVIPVPDRLSDEEAVFAEPLSCCLNALELSRLKEGETICIWGAGPAGTLLSRASVALGAIPTVIDPDPRRCALIGGNTRPTGRHYDVAVVAVGSAEAYDEALACLSPRGRLVVFSGLSPDRAVVSVDFNRLHYYEQTVVGAYGCSYRHGEDALSLLASGAVPVRDLISHRLPLRDLDEALGLVERRECMKIHLYPDR
ncbi:MAG: alcohol dehydrogenase catalytic domain-containing protein [Desulfobacterales bacterium]|nr:alcohol dehydrogenase catalytic domain-containing protein [Desulfobacterales bacterium]